MHSKNHLERWLTKVGGQVRKMRKRCQKAEGCRHEYRAVRMRTRNADRRGEAEGCRREHRAVRMRARTADRRGEAEGCRHEHRAVRMRTTPTVGVVNLVRPTRRLPHSQRLHSAKVLRPRTTAQCAKRARHHVERRQREGAEARRQRGTFEDPSTWSPNPLSWIKSAVGGYTSIFLSNLGMKRCIVGEPKRARLT